MVSFGVQLFFFLFLVLVLSPQIHAREGKPFNFFTLSRTTYDVKNSQLLLKKPKFESPAPALAPTSVPAASPAIDPKIPRGSASPAPSDPIIPSESIIPSLPAPEPEPDFIDKGDGYGLYGRTSTPTQYSPIKDTTPTTTTFENKLLNEDFNDESYKTVYPKTNFNSNYNNEVGRDNFNKDEYRSNYNNGYNNNYNDKGNYYNNNYNGNGYEGKREGMSDTRFVEDGKYNYQVNNYDDNYNLNGSESGKETTENGSYYEKNQYQNEFDNVEEYERPEANQEYTP